MNAKKLLDGLERLARVAQQLAHDVADLNNDGKVNWHDFVAASKDEKIEELVNSLLGQAKRADVYQALAEINRKRGTLANGRSYADMSSQELEQYEALRATEKVLYQAADKLEADRGKFFAWLVDDALPVLRNALKVAIPLF